MSAPCHCFGKYLISTLSTKLFPYLYSVQGGYRAKPLARSFLVSTKTNTILVGALTRYLHLQFSLTTYEEDSIRDP